MAYTEFYNESHVKVVIRRDVVTSGCRHSMVGSAAQREPIEKRGGYWDELTLFFSMGSRDMHVLSVIGRGRGRAARERQSQALQAGWE